MNTCAIGPVPVALFVVRSGEMLEKHKINKFILPVRPKCCIFGAKFPKPHNYGIIYRRQNRNGRPDL